MRPTHHNQGETNMTDTEWEDPTKIQIVYGDANLEALQDTAIRLQRIETDREVLLSFRHQQTVVARAAGLSWSKINEASRQKNAQVGFDRRNSKA
jgi:hypothetical protein